MKLEIKNLGKITNTTVELGDMTTIVGKNDSGKSTLGKAIYSVVKPTSEGLKSFFHLQNNLALMNQLSMLEVYAKNIEFDSLSLREIKEKIDFFNFNEDRISLYERIEAILEQLKLSSFKEVKVEKERVLNVIENTQEILKASFRDEKTKTRMAYLAFQELFNNPIQNGKNECKVILGETELVHSSKQIDDRVSKKNFSYSYQENELPFEEVIMIESFDVLETIRVTPNPVSTAPKNGLINIISDSLNDKMGIYDDILYANIDKIEKEIEKTIKGRILYDPKKNKLKLKSDNDFEYDFKDVATGIQCFATYKLILKKLNSKVILILDEPEAHLHPEWQVILAKLLVMINKELSTKIVINTHSAFFLEAIEAYGKKYNLENKFYYCDNGNFEDVSNNLEKAYAKVNGNAYTFLDDILNDGEINDK